ncbi:MAG: holo-ACP synthase [Gemmatimonadaceae bacterium]|nr:holo-ACP synthase [Gemmatimonadaceae bacterium]
MIVGVGMDLVEIARIEGMLQRSEQRVLERLFTEAEVAYATARARPAMHLAARFAAKEAAFKALAGSEEARLIGWKEIEVVPRANATPLLAFTGRAEARAAELGVAQVWLTLTHTDTTAGAVCVLER